MKNKKLEERLEIRLYPGQLKKLKEEASEKKTSVANIVREAIEQRYEVSPEDKQEALKNIAKINAPVSEWEQIKKEITRGNE